MQRTINAVGKDFLYLFRKSVSLNGFRQQKEQVNFFTRLGERFPKEGKL